MKYIFYINQEKAIEWDLSFSECCLIDLFINLPKWSDVEIIDGLVRYFFSKNKILEEAPILSKKGNIDTIYRQLKGLVDKGFLNYKKIGYKDFWQITGKIIEWEFKPNSEKNPSYVGKKSESYSEKNPTYNNINNNNINNNKINNQKSEDFGDFNFSQEFKDVFFLYEKHRKEKKSKLTEVARNQLLKKSSAVGEKIAIEKIQESIQNGRTGVFFDKPKKQIKTKMACEDKTKDFNFFD